MFHAVINMTYFLMTAGIYKRMKDVSQIFFHLKNLVTLLQICTSSFTAHFLGCSTLSYKTIKTKIRDN